MTARPLQLLIMGLCVVTIGGESQSTRLRAGERHRLRRQCLDCCGIASFQRLPVRVTKCPDYFGVTCPPAPHCPSQCGVATSSAPVVESSKPVASVPSVPKSEVVLLGYSVKGIPITMHVFGDQGRAALIFGAIHGSEPNSGDLARQLVDHLIANPAAYAGRRVALIPVANPDGLVRTKRLNEHQIDLNRNFPAVNWKVSKPGSNFGGEKPASEPETQAIIKAVELLDPDRIVSIHAITKGRECNNYDGPGAELAELMKSKNGYRVAKSIGYPTPGSFGSWAGIDRQIATITLELPTDLPGDQCWEKHREALLAVIQHQAR